MIREFLRKTDGAFFLSMDADRRNDPMFLSEVVLYLHAHSVALLQFIEWLYERCDANETFFQGALFAIAALRKFDYMKNGDHGHFFATVSLIDESLCKTQSAALLDNPDLFYSRMHGLLGGETADENALVKYLSQYKGEMIPFGSGVYAILDFFSQLEEAGKLLPETRLLN